MKTNTNTQYLEKLISEGEHVHQDFKFAISDARKIAKSLSAFANTEGGRLLVGVKDNGKIAGVRSEEELYMISSRQFILPSGGRARYPHLSCGWKGCIGSTGKRKPEEADLRTG